MGNKIIENIDYEYNRIIIIEYTLYNQDYQVNYYNIIHNEELQRERVLSCKL